MCMLLFMSFCKNCFKFFQILLINLRAFDGYMMKHQFDTSSLLSLEEVLIGIAIMRLIYFC